MCGIAGELRFDGDNSNRDVVKLMCDTQSHRGPDDEGYYHGGPVCIGIKRLSIIDLSKGLYPLRNENGTLVLVFNGEIYGFHELRRELESSGHVFSSNTDGECIVHAYEEWGFGCLDRFDGMYAFALWDENSRVLWLARDPFGIKPLYYVRGEKFFAFASEIKPLLSHPEVTRIPNAGAIEDYLRRGLVDTTEETFFTGVRRLAPAHHLTVTPNRLFKIEKYWTPSISKEIGGTVSHNDVNRTRSLFLEAVRLQLISDVPVGTCLSGGIDSSSIVCAIKKLHPKGAASIGERIKTFSAVFPGETFDESEYIRQICAMTGAEQNTISPTAEELWADLPAFVRCQEEPVFSTSIYAQWRVMKLAKGKGVTVVLDGQGGDELLAGYHPYYQYFLLNLIREGSYAKFASETARASRIVLPIVRSYLKHALKRALGRGALGSIVPRTNLRNREVTRSVEYPKVPHNDLSRKLLFDVRVGKLPALLRYEDKNSMWFSIEARVPFLHRQFFEHVASLPLGAKLNDGFTKYVFRLAMADLLPENVRLRRNKIGFETPERKWMEALSGRLVEFFSEPRACGERFYDSAAFLRLLRAGSLTNEEANLVWRVLNLEIWYEQFFEKASKQTMAP